MKIAIGITGASGSIYAQLLIEKLKNHSPKTLELSLVFSQNAKDVWQFELGNDSYKNYESITYQNNDFTAPFASGSAGYDALILCPCSMGTMGRIASGISSDLMTRAADVMLKERKKLILAIRETPLNLIHLKNLSTLTESGAIICPASPSFYSKPQSIEALAMTVVDRLINLCGLETKGYKWGNETL